MKRKSIEIFAIAVILLCGALAFSQTIIPSWFEVLPESPEGMMLAIGYSGMYQDKNLARQVAIIHALRTMAKQKQIRLIFEIEEIADGRFRLLAPTFEEFYEESILIQIMGDYKLVDSLSTEEGYFVLVAHPFSNLLSIRSSGGKSWGEEPEWTKQLPVSKEFEYGIGMVGRYSSWVRAWKDADEYARFDLGKNIRIKTESIHTVERDNRFTIESKIIRQSYDMSLHNSVIISRWYDSANDTYYSLCLTKR